MRKYERLYKSKYPQPCSTCNLIVATGVDILWDARTKAIRHVDCSKTLTLTSPASRVREPIGNELGNGLYVIHFATPLNVDDRYGDKQHYVGISGEVPHRLNQHMRGEGSKVTRQAHEAGVAMMIGCIIPNKGDTASEKAVTQRPRDYCSVCLKSVV